jgi:hypothetical protein
MKIKNMPGSSSSRQTPKNVNSQERQSMINYLYEDFGTIYKLTDSIRGLVGMEKKIDKAVELELLGVGKAREEKYYNGSKQEPTFMSSKDRKFYEKHDYFKFETKIKHENEISEVYKEKGFIFKALDIINSTLLNKPREATSIVQGKKIVKSVDKKIKSREVLRTKNTTPKPVSNFTAKNMDIAYDDSIFENTKHNNQENTKSNDKKNKNKIKAKLKQN